MTDKQKELIFNQRLLEHLDKQLGVLKKERFRLIMRIRTLENQVDKKDYDCITELK